MEKSFTAEVKRVKATTEEVRAYLSQKISHKYYRREDGQLFALESEQVAELDDKDICYFITVADGGCTGYEKGGTFLSVVSSSDKKEYVF